MPRAHVGRMAIVAAMLAFGACAAPHGAALDRAALLSDAPRAATPRDCRVAPDPARLPAAGALVDSVRLTADARTLWEAAGRPAGYVLFSMRFDAAGTNVRRAVLETSVPRDLADTLQQRLFQAARTTEPADEEWGVRLRIDLGDAPRLRVGRREDCAPYTNERLTITRSGGMALESGDPWESASARPSTWLRVQVGADGFVTDAQIEGGVGTRILEQRALTLVRGLRFEPATEDGYPVTGVVRLRIHQVD